MLNLVGLHRLWLLGKSPASTASCPLPWKASDSWVEAQEEAHRARAKASGPEAPAGAEAMMQRRVDGRSRWTTIEVTLVAVANKTTQDEGDPGRSRQ